MKSKLFKRGHSFDQDEKVGVRAICELPDEEFSQILKWYVTKIKESATRRPSEILLLTKESNYSAKEILDGFDYCFSIIFYCFDEKDDLKSITDDLIEEGIIGEDRKDLLTQRLGIAYSSFESDLQSSYIFGATTGYIDRLLGWNIKCEIVPKFDQDFKVGKRKVDEYTPTLIDLFPVIRLSFIYEDENSDDDKSKAVFYIVNETMIDRLIDSLLAAKIELNVIDRNHSKYLTK